MQHVETLYVENVGKTLALYERAFGCARRFVTPEGDYGELDTGAGAVQAPKEAGWGQTIAHVSGCDGFLVEICIPVGV